LLAPEEDGAALDALRFSLASDIVELVVLTGDEVFLQTLREAVGGARRLWHVPSADKVGDLLLAGEVGILVLDADSLVDVPAVFIAQIKRQFPDLVVVVAGNRDAEAALAALISEGTVYRFIHKPMSPGRARLFADAAVRKYEGQRGRTAFKRRPAQRRFPTHRRALIGGAIGVLGAVAIATWALQKSAGGGSGTPPRAAGAAHPSKDDSQLAAASAPAPAPADVQERLLSQAENALLEERLDEAAAAIESARRAGVESGRIAFLKARLAKSREHIRAAQMAAQAAGRTRTVPKAGADTVATLLSLAAQRQNEARLVEPEHDSALFYVSEALRLDPDNDAAQEARQALALRFLRETHAAIERHDFAQASAWLAAARGIAAAANIEAAEASLAAARRQADADARAATD
jgi:hypothetical protein